MDFNKEQKDAIYSKGNIIVSAGAGSGKTTVLTERVKQNILGNVSGKVALDELLILTFTNDAATSMKNKIKEALSANSELSDLVPFVDSTHIETFDAYSQFILKKFGQRIGINTAINVLDNDILFVKIANTLRNILDNQYLENNATFAEIIYKYCLKNDNKFFQFLLDIFNEILLKQEDPAKFLEEYRKNILTKDYFEDLLVRAGEIATKYLAEIKEKKKELNDINLLGVVDEAIAPLSDELTVEYLITLNEFFDSFGDIWNKLKKCLDDLKDSLNYDIDYRISKEISKRYRAISALSYFLLDDYRKYDIEYQITYLNYIIDNILLKTLSEIDRFKKETGFYTFGDIAKLSIKILKENEDIRNELKYKYKLIMIDETQDTSESQEEFIDLIANNNVFSVGDIKQSIYRFRNARPELFKRKYDKYSALDGGRAINMNKNFRSRREILDMINIVFSRLMTNEFGGADYAKDHLIEASNTIYDEYKDQKHGIFQMPYSGIYFDKDGNEQDNAEAKVKAEASAICDNIIKRMNNGYHVYDAKEKRLRPARYSDFTILTYKGKKFKYFEEVFKEKNIPLNVIYTDDLKEDNSIVVLINIFSLINILSKEEKNDGEVRHLLASILRSFVFNYSDGDLYKIFTQNKDGYKEDEIYLKILNLSKNFAKGSLKLLFEKVMKEFNYIKAFARIEDAINTLDKNNIFYNKTKTMDELGYTLDDFVLYLKSLSNFNIKMDQTIYSEKGDAVTLTTIHKSKGLEYNLVYLPCLYDFIEPKFKNNGDYYVLSGKYFFLPFFADPHKDTNLIGLILENDKGPIIADKEERLRLLYVALTRAKEDLVLVLSKDKVKDYVTVFEEYVDRVERRYAKRNVSLTEEEALKIAKYELETYVQDHNGANFNEFLFNAFVNYDLDPFMDQRIMDLDQILEEQQFEDQNLEKVFKKEILKAYIFSNHSFDNVDFASIKEKVEKEFSAPKAVPSKEVLLWEGAIKVYSEYLLKIKEIIFGSDNIELEFYFYCFKKLKVTNLTVEVVDLIKKELDINKTNKLEEILKKYFVKNEDEKIAFNSIESKEGKKVIEINIEKENAVKLKKASKDRDDESDETTLDFGTHIHSLLETVSFNNPNLDFISSEREKHLVEKTLKLLETLNVRDAKDFKEYQFVDETNGRKGIIDLLLVFEDKAIVVDYKLKNINDEKYKGQLNVYKKYIESAFSLPTKTYLLSIIDSNLVEIK